MRKLLNILGCLAMTTIVFISCDFKDKGLLEVSPISDILIDTTGIPATQSLDRGDELIIKPKISRAGVKEGDLSYEWRITKRPGNALADYDLIGKEEHLKAVITLAPSTDAYMLWLRVTDKSTGLISGLTWPVVVETPVNQGLVVADSDDGVNSDLSVIQDTIFTFNWYVNINATPIVRKPTLIRKNEFSRVHKRKFKGIINSLFAQRLYFEGIYRNFLHGASRTDAFRINTIDYSILAEGKQLFYDPTVVLNIDRYFVNVGKGIIMNSNKVCARETERNTDIGYAKFGIPKPGDYKANKHIAVHPTLGSNAIFYDEGLGKFLMIGSYYETNNKPQEGGVETLPFAPRNLPGYTVLGGGIGNLAEVRFVLKKEDYYGVFTLTSAGVPRRVLDISNAPDIKNAVSFVFPSDQAVIYYATASQVYSIRIPQGSAPTYTHLYSSPEPITMLEMLRRSGSRTVQYTERCLLAITYNGNEGKVTTLPIPSSGLDLGIIDLSRSAVFGGFKKISAVAVQE
uniref:PKD-like family lipoprotein n=1 Tax=Pedobacter schmidteae TaxID=2201271 RepID=UPI000EABA576|nr:PKD-like family lipoprotein [Pedobacter schmidteae]